MRLFAVPIIVIASALPVFSALADATANEKDCSAAWEALAASDKSKLNYEGYLSTCMNDGAVSSSVSAAPDMASVTGICRDNTYTKSRPRATACLHRGGVSMWFAGT
jgi:hypothetical protein